VRLRKTTSRNRHALSHYTLLTDTIQKNITENFDWLQPEQNGEDGDAEVPPADPKPQVYVKELHHHDAARAVLDEISASSVQLLILPRRHAIRSTSPEFELERRLFRDAACETMQLRLGEGEQWGATT